MAPAGIEALAPQNVEKARGRENVSLKRLLTGKIESPSETEKAVIVLGRKIAKGAETKQEQDALEGTWQGSVMTHAVMSQIRHGDQFQGGGISISYQGAERVITHVDPVDPNLGKDTPLCLRMGHSATVIPLDDQAVETKKEAVMHLSAVPSEGQNAPDVQLATAFFEGRQLDKPALTEVAQNLGFVTPDIILDIAQGDMKDKDGNPFLTPDDIKTLRGEQRPDGVPIPPLSQRADKMKGILGSDVMLSKDQVKQALFLLEIPTDSTQLSLLKGQYQNELKELSEYKTSFTHTGDVEGRAKLKQMNDRLQWLDETITSYKGMDEKLLEQTGSGKFDAVHIYYELIENGGGDAAILDQFKNIIVNPTIENVSKFDDSYAARCGEHATEENTRQRKAFLKKFIMGAGLGMGGLMAFQVWRASKKDEGQ